MKNKILENYKWAHLQVPFKLKSIDAIVIILGVIAPFISMAFSSFVLRLLESEKSQLYIFTCILVYACIMKVLDVLYQIFQTKQTKGYMMIRLNYAKLVLNHESTMLYEKAESSEGRRKYKAAMEALFSGNDIGLEKFLVSFVQCTQYFLGFLLYSFFAYKMNTYIFFYMICTSIAFNFLTRQKSLMNEFTAFYLRKKQILKEAIDKENRATLLVYHAKNWMLKKCKDIHTQYIHLLQKQYHMVFVQRFAQAIVDFLRDLIVYLYLIFQVSHGNLTLSQLFLYTGIVAGYSLWIQQFFDSFIQIRLQNDMVTSLHDYMEYGKDVHTYNLKVPQNKDYTIQFEHVSYHYPDNDKEVLHDISMTLHSYETIALVGVNGAGKSTFIKLLLGLYTPSQGRILLNGIDIQELDKTSYYALFSAVFQEPCVLATSIAQNVACQIHYDKEKVIQALKKAQLLDKVKSLPHGIDTVLTKNLDSSGIELSGGQTQNLMLARAIYQDQAILILDEPTSALDPIRESKMYESYHQLMQNKSSVFISHRLASTRFCDTIYLLAHGQIIESGDHDSLMKQQGMYYRMYEMQAKYYKEGLHHE